MAITDIFNEGNLFKLRLIIYSVLICLSIVIFVSVPVMRANTELTRCPLYMEKKNGVWYSYSSDGSPCNYVITVAVVFQFCSLLLRMFFFIMKLLGKLSESLFLYSSTFEFFYVILDYVSFVLTLVGACILSVGSNWEFKDIEFDWRASSRAAQGGAWISTIIWLFIAQVGFYVTWRLGKIPIVGGKKQDAQPPPKQAEMVDPASEKFRI